MDRVDKEGETKEATEEPAKEDPAVEKHPEEPLPSRVQKAVLVEESIVVELKQEVPADDAKEGEAKAQVLEDKKVVAPVETPEPIVLLPVAERLAPMSRVVGAFVSSSSSEKEAEKKRLS